MDLPVIGEELIGVSKRKNCLTFKYKPPLSDNYLIINFGKKNVVSQYRGSVHKFPKPKHIDEDEIVSRIEEIIMREFRLRYFSADLRTKICEKVSEAYQK